MQFAVVEQRVFGNGQIELVVRCHGERLHGRLFIPGTQVTVCQVVRGILRQCILGTAGLAQELHGLGIACRAVKREAHQVAAVTVEFAAGSRKGVQVPDGLVIVAQVKPRFGDDTLQFLPAFGHGTARQFVAVFDDIAVVSVAEFDLQEVIRHHGAVGIAALQGREALLRTPVAPLGIVDIGFVIECVVGILALGADAVEITERLVVIAFGDNNAFARNRIQNIKNHVSRNGSRFVEIATNVKNSGNSLFGALPRNFDTGFPFSTLHALCRQFVYAAKRWLIVSGN